MDISDRCTGSWDARGRHEDIKLGRKAQSTTPAGGRTLSGNSQAQFLTNFENLLAPFTLTHRQKTGQQQNTLSYDVPSTEKHVT